MKEILIFRRATIILGMFIISNKILAQEQRHPIELADQKVKITPKNLIVFIHADWCNYCKAMENKTFANKNVQELMNGHFFYTELNAEEKRDIVFAGKTFKYKPAGMNTGLHELAFILGNIEGQVSYPTVTILNSEHEIIFQYTGFLSAKDFAAVLTKIIHQTN